MRGDEPKNEDGNLECRHAEFPACAGMNRGPFRLGSDSVVRRVPRMRGDEPFPCIRNEPACLVREFPACAGMNRTASTP